MAKPAKKSGPKKAKRNVPNGVAHIQSTFNNTIVSITDTAGEVISWSSAGASGFKGARKGTPFAAQTAAEAAARRALEQGMRQIEVLVRGPGSGRETAIRALQVAGLEITLIREYRERLIADVVTGKLDVRHIEIAAPADAPIADEDDALEAELEGDDAEVMEGADADD